MSSYSARSLGILATADVRLQRVFRAVDRMGYAHTILEGHRGQARQDELVRVGRSQTPWPNSQHNAKPSRAIDAKPDGVTWQDAGGFTLFAGYVLAVADTMQIQLRWGGDWNSNRRVDDNNFDDLAHFELIDP